MTRKPAARSFKSRKKRPAEDQAVVPAVLGLVETALSERKAVDGLVLDLRHLSDATDFFLICSGTSDTHVRAIAEHVIESLQAAGTRPYQVEGLSQGRWVLVDYVDFVVHVFHPSLRTFYQLEGLWGDAPQRRLTS